MDLELTDRVCVITGASAGIGRGAALCLAAEGARIVAVARRQDKLAALAAEFESRGLRGPLTVALDVTDADAPAAIAAAALEVFGHVDVLVNSAGRSATVPPMAGDDVWAAAMDLNFGCRRRIAQALLDGMIARNYGRIINITGSREPASTNASIAANGATHAWAKGLSRDVARHGVTVNSIGPGRIMSEQIKTRLYPTADSRKAFSKAQIPAGHFGEPEDIGRLVAFLASPAGRYITGQIIMVDGGMARFSQ